MRYSEGEIVNGRLVEKNIKIINSSSLTCDCWLVQIKGLEACKTCDIKDTKKCGGGMTLKQLKKKK